MGKYQELLKKFYKETDFLAHSTAYEARTVQEFAEWLDQQSAQQSGHADLCLTCGGNEVLFEGSERQQPCPDCRGTSR